MLEIIKLNILAHDQAKVDQYSIILGWNLGIAAMTVLFLIVIFKLS